MIEMTTTYRNSVRVLQVIWFAMLSGVGLFLVFVLFKRAEQPVAEPMLSYLAVAFAAGAAVVSSVLPLIMKRPVVANALAGTPDEMRAELGADCLVPAFQTLLIVQLAILEGAAFFAGVAYLLEGLWWTFAAACVLWLLILARFPATGRVRNWCRSEYETAELSKFR